MKQIDNNFKAFCVFYRNADFNNAANVLYMVISKLVKNELLISPLIKLDFVNMLQDLSERHVPVPTPGIFHKTVDKAVRYLEENSVSDIRAILN